MCPKEEGIRMRATEKVTKRARQAANYVESSYGCIDWLL
jgi:hypothetical protein